MMQVFQQDERLWSTPQEDSKEKEFNQTMLLNLSAKLDKKLIQLLLQDKEIKKKFFFNVEDAFVFKAEDFRFFIEENKLDNSYSDYKNRLGLAAGRRFIQDSEDVVLDFPFKDCILQGGQSTEEGKDTYFEWKDEVNKKEAKDGLKAGIYNSKKEKRKEIFFNQIIAHDEIDRLKDPKALVNWKRYDKEGDQKISRGGVIERDKEGTIKENLIIKGNNYLAMQSLKQQFLGKIKLIYIDPPYNTGGDANIFTYNNNFNHSTWLTFMKNRLEIGKQLLREDGFIAIAIDHSELFYLGALADEIFGRENRLGIITVMHHPAGRTNDKFFATTNEYMLIYAKNVIYTKIKNFEISKETKNTFNKKDDVSQYKLENLIRKGETRNARRIDRPKQFYPIYVSPDLQKITLNKKKNYFEILPIENSTEWIWSFSPSYLQKNIENNNIVAIENKDKVSIYYKRRLIDYKGKKPSTTWIDKKYNTTVQGTRLLKSMLEQKTFPYPKSLYTVLDTLKITTEKDDIILDFFAGSGTTAHATLSLNKEDGGNRKFILVEQLDKHIAVCLERNQKVLKQENLNSSFLYLELAKWNEKAKEKILSCKTLDELTQFFSEMVEKYFLKYNLKIKEFQEKILEEENFLKLSLKEQKKIFIAMLDNNQMYIPASEMEDARFDIHPQDRSLTKKFYNQNNN